MPKKASGLLKSTNGTNITGKFWVVDQYYHFSASIVPSVSPFETISGTLTYDSLNNIAGRSGYQGQLGIENIELRLESGAHIIGQLKSHVVDTVPITGHTAWSQQPDANNIGAAPQPGQIPPQSSGTLPQPGGTPWQPNGPPGSSTPLYPPHIPASPPTVPPAFPPSSSPGTPSAYPPAGPPLYPGNGGFPGVPSPALSNWASPLQEKSQTVGIHRGTKPFDNSLHASKVIRRLVFRCDGVLERMGVHYDDGTVAGPDPITNTAAMKHEYELSNGEHIVGILIWAHEHIFAAQFITSCNRLSDYFGLHSGKRADVGTPTLIWFESGILGAFAGNSDGWLRQIRAIWTRTQAIQGVPQIISHSYHGTARGSPFNDYEFMVHPPSARVSSVIVYTSPNVVALQFTYRYSDHYNTSSRTSEADHRGSQKLAKASRHVFTLTQDEWITRVEGAVNNRGIQQLSFITNTGKQGGPYGNAANGARFQANPSISGDHVGLKFVVGKANAAEIGGLLFAWGSF